MNHAPQLEYEVEIFDKNGKLREHRINSEPIVQDYRILATVTDKDGRVVSTKELPFKSFTSNFVHVINNNFFGVDNATLIKTTAAAVAPTATCTNMDVMAAINIDTYGIVVGTNDTTTGSISGISMTVAAPSDWHLKHLIADGTSAGEISYSAMSASPFAFSTGEISFSRTFTNATGSAITVKEVGMIGNTNTTDNFLICRDVRDKDLTTVNIPVADTEALTITYTFSNKSLLQATASTQLRTITDNFLAIVYDLLTLGGVDVVKTSGLTANVDFASNPTYQSVLAGAGAETFGIIIGNDGYYVNSGDYQVSIPHAETTFSYGASTALTLEQSQENIMNPRGIAGSSPRNITFLKVGVQRDFQNISGGNDDVNEIGLLVQGTGGFSYLIGKIYTHVPYIDVAPLETLRIKIRLSFMIYDPFG